MESAQVVWSMELVVPYRFPRWMKAALVMAFMALLAGGWWIYCVQVRQLRQQAEAQLTAIAELKVRQIVEWRKERLSDAAVLAESPFLTEAIAQWLADSRPELTQEIQSRFRSLRAHYHYDDVLFAAPDGQVRLSLSGVAGALHGEAALAVAATWRDHKPVLTELYADEVSLSPHLVAVAPLFSGTGEAQKPLGAILLASDARQFLYPLIQSWPAPSKTSETLLVRRDGDHVLFLNELRCKPDTALKLRLPLSQTDVPAVMAVLGREGVTYGHDYRGVEVVSVLKAISDSAWFMVAKEDATEIFAFWRVNASLILALLFGVLALAAAGVMVIWQRNQKAHYRAQYQAEAALRASEERYGLTLESIGDAVITTDAQGQLEFLNPVAETLTGWKQAEACGRPLAEVFQIINEHTRQAVEDPVTRVLREGLVVSLANHTLLIAKDGAEIPVADSGAPIRSDQDKIIGVVLVFRDQTKERQAQARLQESEIRLELALHSAQMGVWSWDINQDLRYFDDQVCRLLGIEPGVFKGTAEEFFAVVHPDDRETVKTMLANTIAQDVLYEPEYRVVWPDGSIHYIMARGRLGCDEAGRPAKINGVIWDITAHKQAEAEHEKLQAQFLQAQKMESVGRLAGGVAHDFNNMLTAILGYTELAMQGSIPGSNLDKDLKEIKSAADRSADITHQLLAFARKQIIAPKALEMNHTVESLLKMLRRMIGEDIDLAWKPGANLWLTYLDSAQINQILANLCVNARDAIAGVGKVTIETSNVILDEAYCAGRRGFIPGEYVALNVSDDGCGMGPDIREHLFEPFFTTKNEGQGTGLGLATVYGIVKQNHGFINVYSEPGHGTTFKIFFPRFLGNMEKDTANAASEIAASCGETVLLVEDEARILNMGETMLRRLGYKVLTAGTPDEAIYVAENHAEQLHLLITDVVMPEMNGRDLAEHITVLKPGIKRLFMSGYTANAIAHHGVLEEGVQFLPKPFTMQDLAQKVREALASV